MFVKMSKNLKIHGSKKRCRTIKMLDLTDHVQDKFKKRHKHKDTPTPDAAPTSGPVSPTITPAMNAEEIKRLIGYINGQLADQISILDDKMFKIEMQIESLSNLNSDGMDPFGFGKEN